VPEGNEGDLYTVFLVFPVERNFTVQHAHPVPVFKGGFMGEEECEVHMNLLAVLLLRALLPQYKI